MQDEDTDAGDLSAVQSAFSRQEPADTGSDGNEGADDGGEQPRDEHGRFASKATAEDDDGAGDDAGQDQSQAAGKDGEDRDGGQIPSWRLREIREERDRIAAEREADRRRADELERRLAAYERQQRQMREAKEAPQRPDPIADPEGYEAWIDQTIDQRTRAIEDQFRDQWVNLTFAEEHEKHGETFDKAMAALEAAKSPQIVADIREAVNPGKALMRWYRRQTAMTEIGDDLEGYQKRLRDQLKKDPDFIKEIRAELEAEARGGSAGRSSNVTSLPSVNKAPGSAGRQIAGSLGDSPEERLQNAFARRR